MARESSTFCPPASPGNTGDTATCNNCVGSPRRLPDSTLRIGQNATSRRYGQAQLTMPGNYSLTTERLPFDRFDVGSSQPVTNSTRLKDFANRSASSTNEPVKKSRTRARITGRVFSLPARRSPYTACDCMGLWAPPPLTPRVRASTGAGACRLRRTAAAVDLDNFRRPIFFLYQLFLYQHYNLSGRV